MLEWNLHLPEDYFIPCFLSDLKEEIRMEVHMFQPRTLTEAITLARRKEKKRIQSKQLREARTEQIGDQQALQVQISFKLSEDLNSWATTQE